MTYRPPISQILLAMQVAGSLGDGVYANLPGEDVQAILDEAGRFAAERIAPLNRIGDQHPAKLVNGKVETPPGWQETYRDWCAGGWNGITGHQEFGGQALPFLMSVACTELWNSACISLALCPLLTTGAIEAITAHASDELRHRYLPKMVSGEWSGTMNLTEPQAGSDLSQLRCKAKRSDDGSYRITGNKIFITYGEHELTSNIVHLVLARLDDAPEGTKGISLFLVPKILPNGERNDLRCHSLEHKLGIHASPTCTMVYGDSGGATGWLIGEENRGLACMFTMMNNARVLVAVQGVALAERAMQAAIAFAGERKQGRATGQRAASPIIAHPDVKRMLLEMRVKTSAARMLCMATAAAIDNHDTATAALFTPLAKLYATDIAVEVASSAIQVHGGMGFVEETGVAQYYRDARILPIYEGTNGIQAIDLVTRKLGADNGQALNDAVAMAEQQLANVMGVEVAKTHSIQIRNLTAKLQTLDSDSALAAATAFTRALATFIASGYLAKAAIALPAGKAQQDAINDARFFIISEMVNAMSSAMSAINLAEIVVSADI